MSKINVNQVIFGKESVQDKINAKAIKKDNKIYFNYNCENYIVEILDDKVILNKSSDNSDIILIFELYKKNNSIYKINEPNVLISLETFTKELIIDVNGIRVIYDLKMNGEYSDTFTYNLTWEVE